MISFKTHGSNNLEAYLKRAAKKDYRATLERIGAQGVQALAAATPKDSGIAANAWAYSVTKRRGGYTVEWSNRNVENGFPVALMVQLGYGTGTGGYVQGRDYINPALKSVFERLSDDIAREVKAL